MCGTHEGCGHTDVMLRSIIPTCRVLNFTAELKCTAVKPHLLVTHESHYLIVLTVLENMKIQIPSEQGKDEWWQM